MPDEEHGWYGPQDGEQRAKCLSCKVEFVFEIMSGGGPAYHINRSGQTCYNVDVIGPADGSAPKDYKDSVSPFHCHVRIENCVSEDKS